MKVFGIDRFLAKNLNYKMQNNSYQNEKTKDNFSFIGWSIFTIFYHDKIKKMV